MDSFKLGVMIIIGIIAFWLLSVSENAASVAVPNVTIINGTQQTAEPTPHSTPPKVVQASTEEEQLTFPLNFSDADAKAYIEKYAQTAIEEMERFGIPASITLGQGLLESTAGKSRLAVKNNNHFGIKCFSTKCHKGHCSNFTDDTHKDFFLIFESAWFSFREHSLLLKKERYKPCFKEKDYKGWAKALRKAGYATDKKYDRKLIYLIKKFELHQYDK